MPVSLRNGAFGAKAAEKTTESRPHSFLCGGKEWKIGVSTLSTQRTPIHTTSPPIPLPNPSSDLLSPRRLTASAPGSRKIFRAVLVARTRVALSEGGYEGERDSKRGQGGFQRREKPERGPQALSRALFFSRASPPPWSFRTLPRLRKGQTSGRARSMSAGTRRPSHLGGISVPVIPVKNRQKAKDGGNCSSIHLKGIA